MRGQSPREAGKRRAVRSSPERSPGTEAGKTGGREDGNAVEIMAKALNKKEASGDSGRQRRGMELNHFNDQIITNLIIINLYVVDPTGMPLSRGVRKKRSRATMGRPNLLISKQFPRSRRWAY
jgi:hypothetical protein